MHNKITFGENILRGDFFTMQLTQKETQFLKDLKSQEKICVEKYTKYASSALDPQLKELFTSIANIEQQHLNTISQIENGNMPSSNSGSGQTVNTSFASTL